MKKILLASLLVAGWQNSAHAAPDGWTLALSWSPQYCNSNLSSKELQCMKPNDFVPDGLKPVYSGTDVPPCSEDPLPDDIADRLAAAIPNRSRLRKIWKTQGACSGMSPGEYAIQLDRATRRVAIPEAYRQPSEEIDTTVADFKAELAKLNPGLVPEAVSLQCNGSWLNQLQVCLDTKFEFRACEAQESDRCSAKSRLRVRPLSNKMLNNAAR